MSPTETIESTTAGPETSVPLGGFGFTPILVWGNTGERVYETGVNRGVLYPCDNLGAYGTGVVWNGLTTVTESPQGATASPMYADNIKYLNLISVETFEATINAYTYPEEWAACDGSAVPSAGLHVGQQHRNMFGLSYCTQIGNDIDGSDHGYKLHLVWGAIAKPSQKAFATINDQPAAIDFSWDLTTTPVAVTGLKPTASMTIDTTKVDATKLTSLLTILYGSGGVAPRLPLPDEVIAIFVGSGLTSVDMGVLAKQPSYNSGTHVITLPTVTGVQWKINGVNKAAGAQPALTAGQVAIVKATAQSGYLITGDDTWTYDY